MVESSLLLLGPNLEGPTLREAHVGFLGLWDQQFHARMPQRFASRARRGGEHRGPSAALPGPCVGHMGAGDRCRSGGCPATMVAASASY